MNQFSKLDAAFVYANEIHAGQIRRKTGMPRLAHLLVVAGTVIEHGGSPDEAIAALLHDAVEDAGGATRLEDIRRRFGPTVASIVDGCTERETSPRLSWKERKQAYVDHLATGSASVQLVAAADKLHNSRALLRDYRNHGADVWRRYNGGKDGTLWYYQTVLEIFRQTGPAGIVLELRWTINQLLELIQTTEPASTMQSA